MSEPKLIIKEESSAKKTRSPPKKPKVEQSVPRKKKLKTDADKAAERAQHLRFGKAEITPDEASRMTKQQKRAMYAAAAARSAAHREVDQYEDDNVGTQALNEGVKSEEAVSDFSKNRYARKLKKKAKLQAKKNTPTAKSSAFGSDKAQSVEATSSEGNSNWCSRWWQKQDIQKSYRAATRSGGTAAQTAGGKAVSNGTTAAKSGMERVIDKGKSVVSTAAKLCLITRKTKEGISFITQIGTGNYNEKTSRLYTDLSFLTASKEIGLEATEVFRALDQGETVDSVKNLLVAPHCLQNRLLNRIDGEIKAAARGEGGYIGIKINSLTDKVLINKLIEASQAGVYIDMVVRGICCLRAGVPDETENIHIISIVGRYLEHSRIYIFGQGERARYYIGSADWMTRSTLRRVEIAAPVTAPALKARLQHIFDTMLADNCNARVQQPDGSYVRRMPGADAVDCQAQFYEEAYQANVHSSLK